MHQKSTEIGDFFHGRLLLTWQRSGCHVCFNPNRSCTECHVLLFCGSHGLVCSPLKLSKISDCIFSCANMGSGLDHWKLHVFQYERWPDQSSNQISISKAKARLSGVTAQLVFNSEIRKAVSNMNGPSGLLVSWGQAKWKRCVLRRLMKAPVEVAEWTDSSGLFQREGAQCLEVSLHYPDEGNSEYPTDPGCGKTMSYRPQIYVSERWNFDQKLLPRFQADFDGFWQQKLNRKHREREILPHCRSLPLRRNSVSSGFSVSLFFYPQKMTDMVTQSGDGWPSAAMGLTYRLNSFPQIYSCMWGVVTQRGGLITRALLHLWAGIYYALFGLDFISLTTWYPTMFDLKIHDIPWCVISVGCRWFSRASANWSIQWCCRPMAWLQTVYSLTLGASVRKKPRMHCGTAKGMSSRLLGCVWTDVKSRLVQQTDLIKVKVMPEWKHWRAK